MDWASAIVMVLEITFGNKEEDIGESQSNEFVKISMVLSPTV